MTFLEYIEAHWGAIAIGAGWLYREIHLAIGNAPIAWQWIADNGGWRGIKNTFLNGKSNNANNKNSTDNETKS